MMNNTNLSDRTKGAQRANWLVWKAVGEEGINCQDIESLDDQRSLMEMTQKAVELGSFQGTDFDA